jgi:hypothetical protein
VPSVSLDFGVSRSESNVQSTMIESPSNPEISYRVEIERPSTFRWIRPFIIHWLSSRVGPSETLAPCHSRPWAPLPSLTTVKSSDPCEKNQWEKGPSLETYSKSSDIKNPTGWIRSLLLEPRFSGANLCFTFEILQIIADARAGHSLVLGPQNKWSFCA